MQADTSYSNRAHHCSISVPLFLLCFPLQTYRMPHVSASVLALLETSPA